MKSPNTMSAAGRVLAILQDSPIGLSSREIWNTTKLDEYLKPIPLNAISQALTTLVRKKRVSRFGVRGSYVFSASSKTPTPGTTVKKDVSEDTSLINSAVEKYIKYGLNDDIVSTITTEMLDHSIIELIEHVGLTRGEVLAISRTLN